MNQAVGDKNVLMAVVEIDRQGKKITIEQASALIESLQFNTEKASE